MYGAILGDIIGSPYEFDRGNKSKDYPLFSPNSAYTDDSVMTLAVADAFLSLSPEAADKDIRRRLIQSMQTYGRKYPYAGYGGMFRRWLKDPSPQPYGSYGNGSAMRGPLPDGCLTIWKPSGTWPGCLRKLPTITPRASRARKPTPVPSILPVPAARKRKSRPTSKPISITI